MEPRASSGSSTVRGRRANERVNVPNPASTTSVGATIGSLNLAGGLPWTSSSIWRAWFERGIPGAWGQARVPLGQEPEMRPRGGPPARPLLAG